MNIEIGSYWVCSPLDGTGITSDSVFCKVLFVGEHSIYIMRTTQFGFTPMVPRMVSHREFLNVYRPIEEYGYTGRR